MDQPRDFTNLAFGVIDDHFQLNVPCLLLGNAPLLIVNRCNLLDKSLVSLGLLEDLPVEALAEGTNG